MSTTVEPRRLHPTVLTLWRLRSLIGLLPGLAGAVAVAVIGAPPALYALAAALAVAGVAAGWWWASRRFARFAYRLGSEVLHVADGVVVLTDAAVPLFRVQHIDIDRGPLERWLDLATLVIHTAAPEADITLPGITAARATAARDEILQASREAATRHGLEDLDAV